MPYFFTLICPLNILLFYLSYLLCFLKFAVSLKPQLKSLPWFPSPPNKIQFTSIFFCSNSLGRLHDTYTYPGFSSSLFPCSLSLYRNPPLPARQRLQFPTSTCFILSLACTISPPERPFVPSVTSFLACLSNPLKGSVLLLRLNALLAKKLSHNVCVSLVKIISGQV